VKDFRIDFEWEASRSQHRESAETWARLVIRVGDQVPTKVESRRSGGLRDGIYVPLFPIAEWAVKNWWRLWEDWNPAHECAARSLRSAEEGFALPDIRLQSTESLVEIGWDGYTHPFAGIQFIEQGWVQAEKELVKDEFRKLVQGVLERLRNSKITSSDLEAEWDAIESSENDDSEREFCELAARLGFDPYGLSDAESHLIEGASKQIEWELLSELANHATIETLRGTIKGFDEFQRLADQDSTSGNLWLAMRQSIGTLVGSPADQGYHAARSLREKIGIQGPIKKLEEVLEHRLGNCRIEGLNLAPLILGVAVPGKAGAPVFGIRESKREDQRRFRLSRALGGYIFANGAAIAGEGNSESQKKNRAFAAELLAPSNELGAVLSGYISSTHVEDLSYEYGVSTHVIEHQIMNHELGILAPG